MHKKRDRLSRNLIYIFINYFNITEFLFLNENILCTVYVSPRASQMSSQFYFVIPVLLTIIYWLTRVYNKIHPQINKSTRLRGSKIIGLHVINKSIHDWKCCEREVKRNALHVIKEFANRQFTCCSRNIVISITLIIIAYAL